MRKLTISGILLERPTKHGDLLAGDGVEESLDNFVSESVFLVLVLPILALVQFKNGKTSSPSQQQHASTWQHEASVVTRRDKPS